MTMTLMSLIVGSWSKVVRGRSVVGVAGNKNNCASITIKDDKCRVEKKTLTAIT